MVPKAPFLLLFAVSLILSTSGVSAVSLSLSTNITTVTEGHSLVASCQLHNFTAPHGNYSIEFRRSEQLILQFDYPEAGVPGSARSPTITRNVHNFSDIDLLPLKITETLYQAQLTQKTVPRVPAPTNYARQYRCDYRFNGTFTESNTVMITGVQTGAKVTFTTNVSMLALNESFLATCTVSHFEIGKDSANFLVSFHSKRDGLLASYVHEAGEVLLSLQSHAKMHAEAGPRRAFPIFDLKIAEKTDPKQIYWCTFEGADKRVKESNYWSSIEPTVTFMKHKSNATERIGLCSISDFTPRDFAGYTVRFFTHVGHQAAHLMATYTVHPNELLEFRAEEVPHFRSITFGSNASFPLFSIRAENATFTGFWWCNLGFMRHGVGHASYKSNSVTLK